MQSLRFRKFACFWQFLAFELVLRYDLRRILFEFEYGASYTLLALFDLDLRMMLGRLGYNISDQQVWIHSLHN
jgi:hypothetical protein